MLVESFDLKIRLEVANLDIGFLSRIVIGGKDWSILK
jgi:hypothetical protein